MGAVIPLRTSLVSGSCVTGQATPVLPDGWVEVEVWRLDRSEDWVSDRFIGEVVREDDLRIVLRSQAPNGSPAPVTFVKARNVEIRGPHRD